MQDRKKNIRHVLNIIVILFITMLLVSGGTFAYLQWRSGTEQQTGLAIQIEENINMHIENPEITDTGLYPTNNCAGTGAMPIDDSGDYYAPASIITIENQTGVIARPKFKLKVKITDVNGNIITNNSSISDSSKPYRYYINYAIAENNGTCTEPLFSGKFDLNEATSTGNGWYNSGWVTKTNSNNFPLISNGIGNGVSFNASAYGTTTHEYRVWAWIDSSYTTTIVGNQSVTDPMQNATISISWSEDSMVEQIKAEAYAVFSSSEDGGDDSLRFYKSDTTITAGTTYASRPVTAVYTGFETSSNYLSETSAWHEYSDKIDKIIFEDEISPVNTYEWFANLSNCTYIDVIKLNTSNVINMSYMFSGSGENQEFIITGMENWDTSKVIYMEDMFSGIGMRADEFNIGDISGWNVANVKSMNYMFDHMANDSTDVWSLDLSDWDVYNVITYEEFENSDKITSPNWYTSYAVYSDQDSSLRFYRTQTNLRQETVWNGLEVTNVYSGIDTEIDYEDETFIPWYSDSSSVNTVVVEDKISPLNTSYWFTDMSECSYIDVSKLDTSNVTDMEFMFAYAGGFQNFIVEGMENWNTSNVTDMGGMFNQTGLNSQRFDIGDISKWNTSNVTDMEIMFHGAGYSDDDFKLDLSGWDVSNVTEYSDFNTDVEDKVIAPNFN